MSVVYSCVYTAGSNEYVALRHSSNAGSGFGSATTISPTGALYYAFQNSLALNSTGYPHVVYHRQVSATNRDIYFRKATAIDGSVWATAVALRTAATDDREPCIAVSGEINIHVAW